MKIKEAFIHLLGGYTLKEYSGVRKIATEAISGWQSDINAKDKEIKDLRQSLGEYEKIYDSFHNRHIKLSEDTE